MDNNCHCHAVFCCGVDEFFFEIAFWGSGMTSEHLIKTPPSVTCGCIESKFSLLKMLPYRFVYSIVNFYHIVLLSIQYVNDMFIGAFVIERHLVAAAVLKLSQHTHVN